MRPVGYLVKHQNGLVGERGLYYDYVLASGGVYIEAEGKLLAARVPVARGLVRGLGEVEPQVVLRHGPIPNLIFDLALSEMMKDISREKYVAVVWKGAYHLEVPEQETTSARVQYQNPDSVILDLHSHGRIGAWFSTKDNDDEQGLKLYGVVGRLDDTPVVALRVGVYSYHHPIRWGQVFDGSLHGAIEAVMDDSLHPDEQDDEHGEKYTEKGGERPDELHGEPKEKVVAIQGVQHRGSWLRWLGFIHR